MYIVRQVSDVGVTKTCRFAVGLPTVESDDPANTVVVRCSLNQDLLVVNGLGVWRYELSTLFDDLRYACLKRRYPGAVKEAPPDVLRRVKGSVSLLN